MNMDTHSIFTLQIWSTLPSFLIIVLQTVVDFQQDIPIVPLEKTVWWIARRLMGTNRLHHLNVHRRLLHFHSSNLKHTSKFPHHSTSNCCTFLSVNNKEPDGTHGKECLMDSLKFDGHQETSSPWWTWTPTRSPLFKFEAYFPVFSSQHFKLLYTFVSKSRNRMVPMEESLW